MEGLLSTGPRRTNGCSQYDIPEAGNPRKLNVSTAQLGILTVIKNQIKQYKIEAFQYGQCKSQISNNVQ